MSYPSIYFMENIRQAFSQIYDTHIDQIYRFVFLKVGSQEAAEDITSDAFSRTWAIFKENQDRIKNMQAFLYKTANNLVIDYYREKGKVNHVSIHDYSVVDPGQDIENMALLNSDLEYVKQGLAGLKEDYQNVIIWHYLDDLPIAEVAELLNKTEPATRVLLHRALKALKETIKQV